MDQKTISKLLLREQKHINFPYYDLVTKHHKTKILKSLRRYFVGGYDEGKFSLKLIKASALLNCFKELLDMFSLWDVLYPAMPSIV